MLQVAIATAARCECGAVTRRRPSGICPLMPSRAFVSTRILYTDLCLDKRSVGEGLALDTRCMLSLVTDSKAHQERAMQYLKCVSLLTPSSRPFNVQALSEDGRGAVKGA